MSYPELSNPCPPCYRSPQDNFRVVNGFSTEGEMPKPPQALSGLLTRPCFFNYKDLGIREITVVENDRSILISEHIWKITAERSDSKAVRDFIGRSGMEVRGSKLDQTLEKIYDVRDVAESKK